MENNQVDINLSTDIKTDRLVPLNITLMSRDINNNSFLLKFKSNGADVQLNNSFTVEVLSVFINSKIEILTQATVYGNTAVWEFDTKYITRNEVVYNYVYVKKDGAPIISADANAFTFNVGLSKIDGNAGKTAETYDRNYEKVLHEFEVAINLTKDEWAQMADEARSLVDETRIFVDEIKDVTVDQFVENKMGEELANLEVNYATRLTGLESNDASLTAQLAETAKFSSQMDFVDILKSRTAYHRLRFKKLNANEFELIADNGNKHVSYSFVKDVNDDFIKLNYGRIGNIVKELINSTLYKGNASNLTGAWTTGTNSYTTEIGATFTAEVYGSEITFAHYANNQGGLWEFIIDGDTKYPVTISTYADTTIALKESIIATGLDEGVKYTIIGTFKGQDPKNPVTTPRGWVRVDPNTNVASRYSLNGYVNNNTLVATLLAGFSNKEMATSLRGASGDLHFVPDHGTGVAFDADPTKYLIDGVEIDFSALGNDQFITINSTFELRQHCNVIFPNDGTIAEFWVSHYIDKSGLVTYSGNIEALKDIIIDTFYPLMIPLNHLVLKESITALGNTRISNADESRYHFTDEQDKTFSVAGISAENKNYIVAGKLDYPLKSYRIGQLNKPGTGKDLFYQERVNAPKIYFQSYQSSPFNTGDTYRWGGQIGVGEINNIYDFMK